jgi:hypothetical protein
MAPACNNNNDMQIFTMSYDSNTVSYKLQSITIKGKDADRHDKHLTGFLLWTLTKEVIKGL